MYGVTVRSNGRPSVVAAVVGNSHSPSLHSPLWCSPIGYWRPLRLRPLAASSSSLRLRMCMPYSLPRNGKLAHRRGRPGGGWGGMGSPVEPDPVAAAVHKLRKEGHDAWVEEQVDERLAPVQETGARRRTTARAAET